MAEFQFSTQNILLRTYLFYISVLALKMFVMSLMTIKQRVTRKVFTNPEDCTIQNVKPRVDDKVERVRRAHLNDVENIPLFMVVSFIYITTNPSVLIATTLFRLFVVTRFIHSFVYIIYIVQQPARLIAFGVGFIISMYMAIQGIMYYL